MSATPIVSLKPMVLADGRTDYFVSIKVGEREVTPHVFRDEYKAAYHVALYDWLLNGTGEEPSIVAFGPLDWPARRFSAPERPSREALIELIMRETTDKIVADGWDHLGSPNVLIQGCKFIRRNMRTDPTEGYEKPDDAALKFAGFIADAFLKAQP